MNEIQIAKTEAAFREVNEAIARTAARFEAEEADFVCECADANCAHRVTADLGDYERVRAHPTRFLIAHGHAEPHVEHVVRRVPGYSIVQKSEVTVARIARRLDPRAAEV